MKFKQFDIWLADLNPRFGTESGKTRPVLIVQSDILNKIHPSSVICPITTNVKENVTILRVNIKKGAGGLKRDSAIMVDQIRAIDNNSLKSKIGRLPVSLHKQLKENLKIVIDVE